jgi:hypothetical protein
VVLTLSDNGAGGTFRNYADTSNITTITLSTTEPALRFRYIPAADAGGTTVTIGGTASGQTVSGTGVSIRRPRFGFAILGRIGGF